MTNTAAQRERLLHRLDAAWAALNDAYADLTDEQLLESGIAGDWSVKDILAHVTTWEEEALKHLPLIIAGGRPPRYVSFGGIDAFNALMTEQKRALSLAEVREQLAAVHRQMIAFISTVPDEQFQSGSRVRRRLQLDTLGHYALHTAALRARQQA